MYTIVLLSRKIKLFDFDFDFDRGRLYYFFIDIVQLLIKSSTHATGGRVAVLEMTKVFGGPDR